MAKMKIISDGTPLGTRIFDADGRQITAPIKKIIWNIEAQHIAEVVIVFLDPDVELEGDLLNG